MKDVVIDPSTGTVEIGPGARLGNVNGKLLTAGFGMPMGQCHCVGIAGHMLGGGWGYFAQHYGLTLDSAIGMKMVDAKGRAHNVNPTENPDLFWALRGSGSGLIGIITKLKFKLFRTDRLKIKFVNVHYEDFSKTAEVLEAWQNWIEWTSKNEPTVVSVIDINGVESMSFNARVGIEFRTAYIEDDTRRPHCDYNAFVGNVKKIFPLGGNLTQTSPTYHELIIQTGLYNTKYNNVSWADVDLNNLDCTVVTPRYVKVKSFYVNQIFRSHQIKNVARVIEAMPRLTGSIQFTSEGGALHVPRNSTAFVHRTDLYSIAIWCDGPSTEAELEEGLKWTKEFIAVTKSMDTGESYQNYMDRDLPDYLERYYAENLARLVRIKGEWDPRNYLNNPLSIPTSI